MTHKVLKSAIAAAGIKDFDVAVQAHVAELNAWFARAALVREQAPLPPQPKWTDFGDETDQAKAYLAANEKYQNAKLVHVAPYPRPLAHPYVDAAARQDGDRFVADFEIVDDDPTDEQTLRAKKNILLGKIYEAEKVATESALPPLGKRRLMTIRESDIRASDAKLAESIFIAESARIKKVADDAAAEHKRMLQEAIDKAVSEQAALDEAHRKAIVEAAEKGEIPPPPPAPAKVVAPSFPATEESAPIDVAAEVEKQRDPAHTQHLRDQEAIRSKLDAIGRAGAQSMHDVEDLTLDDIDSYQIPKLG